jgi:hypothetical protein
LATPVADSDSMVQLTWTNTTSTAQNIEVQRKMGPGGTYQQIALLPGNAASYTDINLDAGTQYFYQVRAIGLAGNSAFSNEANATPPRPTIVSRYTFYNKSFWDGQNGSSNIADNLAVATDKQALLPGQTATFQNYTSYSNGTNGIIIDVKNFEGVISLDDFTLKVGNNSDPSTWQDAPEPAFVAMYPGFGVGGTTRFELLWDNGSIENEWLQVTLKADAVTKLAAPDVFYFGNAIGESGNSAASAVVDVADEQAASAHRTGLGPAAITSLYDYNRDKRVDTADQLIARSQAGGPALQLIAAPASGAGAQSLLVDPASEAQAATVNTAASPISQRRPLVDAALAALFLAPDPAAAFKSPLAATQSHVSEQATLIDEALLTDIATSQSRGAHVQLPPITRTSDSADDASSTASNSPCDRAESGIDTAFSTDLSLGRLSLRRAHRRGGAA